jgi:hypothetical protein
MLSPCEQNIQTTMTAGTVQQAEAQGDRASWLAGAVGRRDHDGVSFVTLDFLQGLHEKALAVVTQVESTPQLIVMKSQVVKLFSNRICLRLIHCDNP